MTSGDAKKGFPLWIPAVLGAIVVIAGGLAFLSRSDDDETAVSTELTAADGNSPGGASPQATAAGTGSPTSVEAATGSTTPIEVGAISIGGAPLPRLSQGGDDPAVGQPFPTISGQSITDGSPLEIKDDGKAKLVLFVAHWCPHCQAEVPLVKTYLEKNPPAAGVDIYAISTSVSSEKSNYPPSAWLAREGWTYPTISDDEATTALTNAGVSGFPFFVAVDKAGNVTKRASGELSEKELGNLMKTLGGD